MNKPSKRPADGADAKPIVEVLKPGESHEGAVARTILRPTVNAAIVAMKYQNISFGNITPDLPDLVKELSEQCAAAHKGDLSRAEAMLVAQAHSLDAIFTQLAMRAASNMGSCPESADRFLRLALKAQTQCRATLETLATIKNPPVVIARQANVTSGPQQINNGVAREIETKPNELLERKDGERLVIGATSQAIGRDQAVAAMGESHRPQKC